jgi:hypothetical protein
VVKVKVVALRHHQLSDRQQELQRLYESGRIQEEVSSKKHGMDAAAAASKQSGAAKDTNRSRLIDRGQNAIWRSRALEAATTSQHTPCWHCSH